MCAYAKGFHFDEESLFVYEKAKPGNGGLIVVEPPDISARKEGITDKKKTTHLNYWVNLNSDRAKEIGLAGEDMIMETERKRLRDAGKPGLAKKIIHVSKEWGDGAGYDILSYNADGSEILIEVKTTLKDKSTGFIITANELECARQNRKKYKIYRIFEFNPNSNSGSVFYLSVEQLEKMRLIPLQYKCEF